MLTKKEQPNCRGKKFGDEGLMHVLGYNPLASKSAFEYANTHNNKDISNCVIDIGKKRRTWFQQHLKEDYNNNFIAQNNLWKYRNSLSDFMVHSVALCNASHYDVEDDYITVSSISPSHIPNEYTNYTL